MTLSQVLLKHFDHNKDGTLNMVEVHELVLQAKAKKSKLPDE